MNVNLDLSSFSGAAGEVGTSTMLVLFVHSSLIPRLFLSHALKKIGEPGDEGRSRLSDYSIVGQILSAVSFVKCLDQHLHVSLGTYS